MVTSRPDDSVITTDRLELRMLDAEFFAAMAEGDRELAERAAGIAVPDGWDERALAHALRRLAQLRADPGSAPWLTRAIVEPESGTMIGRVGFHEPPGAPSLARWAADGDAGRLVEIGYAVFEPYRERGYATEAARGLMAWAAERGVTRVVASVSPANTASLHVVARLGFVRVGERMDERDGIEHVFVRDVCAGSGATGTRS